MKIRVLGAAAGGGFPQWNCSCRNCDGVRRKRIRAVARTQSSITITSDSQSWVLLNASPDVLHQISAWPEANPRRTVRDSVIAAILLTDSQIDQAAGLLLLREGASLNVYTTAAVYEDLTHHLPILTALEKYCGVNWREIKVGEEFKIRSVVGLLFRATPIAGKAPPYSPFRALSDSSDTCTSSSHTVGRNTTIRGTNIALTIEDEQTGRRLFYCPTLESFDGAVKSEISLADCAIIDGTFWTDDELIRMGISHKSAADMGHLPLSGESGMLAQLGQYPHVRKILVHINNTNPILDEDSPERRIVEEAGVEVAFDGIEIEL